MRFKKIVSGLLACAMVVTSVFTGNVTTAKAEGEGAADPVPVSTYNFDVSGDNGIVSLGDGVELKSSPNNASGSPELNDYTGAPKFVAGRSGKTGDYAVDTEGKHGIILPDKQLGEDYTVSFWVKPTDLSKGKWATSLLFIGRSEVTAAAQWVSICTSDNKGALTCWSLGNETGGKGISVKQDEWQMLTIVQSGTNAKFYLNGEKKIEQNNYHKGMTEADQYIALGTNHWDGNFYGCYDDVNVYGQALTDDQVYKLFDSRTEEENFAQAEIEVTERLDMIKGGSVETIDVELPGGIARDKMEVSFTSEDSAIAEVDEKGNVTPKAVGNTKITTTVALKDSAIAPKTKETIVAVTEGNGKILAVDYDFDNSEGTVLKDKSGNNHDGEVHGDVTFADGGMTLKNDGYVGFPTSIMDDLDNKEQFTIEVEFAKSSSANNAWLFCFGSKPQGTGTNYMFLSPNFGGNTLRAGIKDSTDEKLFSTSIQTEVNKSYTVNMVFDQGKIKLYWNGILIQGSNGNVLDSEYSIMKDVVTPGCEDDVLGFIGKSCWSADKNFEGTVSKFKIYNRVMTDEEIQVSFSETFSKIFQQDLKSKILGSNASEAEIRYNLSLPSMYEETPITWTSSNTDVISARGVVKNPAAATEVKMTAAVKSGYLEGNAEFNLTVLPADKTELAQAVEKAKTEKENPYRSEASKAELQKLIDRAETASSQTEIDNLVKSIQKAVAKTDYSNLYKDPFTEIQGEKLVKTSIDLVPNAPAVSVLNDYNAAIPSAVREAVTVSYKTQNAAVATVDAAGNVTGKGIGYTLIITTVTAKYDSFALEYYTQVKVDLNLSGVQVSAKDTTLSKGKTTNIIVPASISGVTPSVTYRAKGAVAVDKNGKVTAKQGGTGTVTVKVSAGGKSITKKVTINVADITGPTSVKIKKSVKLKVVGVKGKVKWSLDKKGKKLATLKNGKLTAKKKAGKVKVTAKVGKITMTKTITIKKK